MAAGTISFFGTRRVVVLPEIDPAAYGSKDLDELCSTLSSLENAVAVLGSVFPLERGKLKLGSAVQDGGVLVAVCRQHPHCRSHCLPHQIPLAGIKIVDRAALVGQLPEFCFRGHANAPFLL